MRPPRRPAPRPQDDLDKVAAAACACTGSTDPRTLSRRVSEVSGVRIRPELLEDHALGSGDALRALQDSTDSEDPWDDIDARLDAERGAD